MVNDKAVIMDEIEAKREAWEEIEGLKSRVIEA